MSTSSQHRSGPVRSDVARAAILRATAELFEQKGYDNLTIEGIAARASVGKQTVYRWWPSKGALISECLFEGLIIPEAVTPPDTGDLKADLLSWINGIFRLLEQPRGEELLRSLIAAAAEHPDVGRRLRDALTDHEALAGRFRNAVASGQLSEDAPLQELIEGLIGTIILRALSRDPMDPAAVQRLLDIVLPDTPAQNRRRARPTNLAD